MDKLFIATSNKNKIIEFNKIFLDLGMNVKLVTPKDFNDDSEPIEDGKDFKDNAIIKAKFYYDKYHLPTIADDSGLSIEFLNGFPGIYSARFMAKHTYDEKNKILIQIMEDAPNRNATFNCVICYIDEFGNINTFEGINRGTIAYEQKGKDGFGYDPIFNIPEFNKTEAELGYEYKNKYSHRAIAIRKFMEYLNEKGK